MRQSKPKFKTKITQEKILRNTRFAIIVAQWNEEFNLAMCESAKKTLEECGVPKANIDVFHTPGAFEIPLLAQKLAEKRNTVAKRSAACGHAYAAILCFATVIKGETYHFELVANESARGLMDVMLKTGVPILNGILAVENVKQAETRAFVTKENKGRELALTALDLVQTLGTI